MHIALGSITSVKPRLSPIQLLLLVQLEGAPKYGYEMLKAIKEEFQGIWEPKTGTIYPALKSLEKHGLIQIHIDHEVDFYHITDYGREILTVIGLRQAENMRFVSKFIITIAKWMSPQFKTSFLRSMIKQPREYTDVYSILLSLIDEGMDKDLKLAILNNMKIVLEERLAYITQSIEDQESIMKWSMRNETPSSARVPPG